MSEKLQIDKSLTIETDIYRYIQFSQFVSLVESKSIYISKVSSWDDPWEGVLSRIPHYDENGKLLKTLGSSLDYMYGQCWSLTPESDALWRIYSPNKEGILIKTKITNLYKIEGYTRAYIGKVLYYNNLKTIDLRSLNHFEGYLLKRDSFQHENEVRLLIDYNDIKDKKEKLDYIELKVNVSDFIEEVIVDPRASIWFYKMVDLYCRRNELKNIKKSKLYDTDIYGATGLSIQWKVVD